MKKETAIELERVAVGEGLELDVDSNYSGRGMMGETTYAVSVPNQAKFTTIVALTASYMEPDSDESVAFCEDCKNFRFDNLGRGIVVY